MNCHNCQHFEYFDDGYEGPEAGFYCSGRDYKQKWKEMEHLRLMQSDAYLDRPKWKCFKPILKDGEL